MKMDAKQSMPKFWILKQIKHISFSHCSDNAACCKSTFSVTAQNGNGGGN